MRTSKKQIMFYVWVILAVLVVRVIVEIITVDPSVMWLLGWISAIWYHYMTTDYQKKNKKSHSIVDGKAIRETVIEGYRYIYSTVRDINPNDWFVDGKQIYCAFDYNFKDTNGKPVLNIPNEPTNKFGKIIYTNDPELLNKTDRVKHINYI